MILSEMLFTKSEIKTVIGELSKPETIIVRQYHTGTDFDTLIYKLSEKMFVVVLHNTVDNKYRIVDGFNSLEKADSFARR